MTETVSYIKNSLRDIYTKGEAQALLRIIMESVCGISTHELLLGKGKEISDKERSKIKDIVDGLKCHKPIQYLLGTADFHGLELIVTPDVLIPRPETAELVDHIINDFKDKSPSILDIGTGSGCIAIALATSIPKAKVTAIDISKAALRVASTNAKSIGADVRFTHGDILSQHQSEDIYDCIVSNPPYIMEREKVEMEQNVLEYEPHIALFVPDDDPLLFYRAIAKFGKSGLRNGGSLYFEINSLCGKEMTDMLDKEGYRDIELINDLYDNERIIKAKR